MPFGITSTFTMAISKPPALPGQPSLHAVEVITSGLEQLQLNLNSCTFWKSGADTAIYSFNSSLPKPAQPPPLTSCSSPQPPPLASCSSTPSPKQTTNFMTVSRAPYAYNTLNYIPANYCSSMPTASTFSIMFIPTASTFNIMFIPTASTFNIMFIPTASTFNIMLIPHSLHL